MNEVTPINRNRETSTDSETFFESYREARKNESRLTELFFTCLALIWIGFTQFTFGAYGGLVPTVVITLFVAVGVIWGSISYRLFTPSQCPSLTRPLPVKAAWRDDDYRALKDAA